MIGQKVPSEEKQNEEPEKEGQRCVHGRRPLNGWFCLGQALLGFRSFFDTGDRAFVYLDLHVIGDLEQESSVFDIGDQTVDAAAGDNAIPRFQVRHQLLMLFLPLLLWANKQKIKDDAHEKKRQQRLQDIRLGSGTWSSCLLS
jgi:hypothetical protein